MVVPTPFQNPRTPDSAATSRTSDQNPRVVSREANRSSSTSACQRVGGAEQPSGCGRARVEERDDSDRGGGGLKDGVEEQVIAGPKRDDEPADAREDEDEEARVRWQQAAGSDEGRGVGGGGGGRRVCSRVLSTSNGVTANRTGSQRARSVRCLARVRRTRGKEERTEEGRCHCPRHGPHALCPDLGEQALVVCRRRRCWDVRRRVVDEVAV